MIGADLTEADRFLLIKLKLPISILGGGAGCRCSFLAFNPAGTGRDSRKVLYVMVLKRAE